MQNLIEQHQVQKLVEVASKQTSDFHAKVVINIPFSFIVRFIDHSKRYVTTVYVV